mgnify:FL=1
MIIFPAIDLLGGNCVRLYRGDYGTADKVANDPVATAINFKNAGARHIHIVDLDGAKNGVASALNRNAASRIIKETGLFAELGGGLRNLEDLDRAYACGVSRMILGSAATDLKFLESALEKYNDRIAVGIDARDGYVATAGWINKTDIYYLDFAKKVVDMGVKTIIFTDISRDGTLEGPNTEMLAKLKDAADCNIIASGGIKNIDHIKTLSDMKLYGAICGKSVYAGTLDLAEAIQICQD